MNDLSFTHAAFNQALAEKKLIGSKCSTCGKIHLPLKPVCPDCHSDKMEIINLSGRGKLSAFSVIYIAPTAMLQAGYDRKNPYCSGVVQLEEGPSICGQILGVDVLKPESIQVGSPVHVTFIERGEGEAKKTFLGFQV